MQFIRQLTSAARNPGAGGTAPAVRTGALTSERPTGLIHRAKRPSERQRLAILWLPAGRLQEKRI
ncbi:MAG: hypothetical protein KME26_23470 [Oscillatoria princeps RMCB-10]|nr:hypothetical protein [Oscillatoria princeps RMCB-10]